MRLRRRTEQERTNSKYRVYILCDEALSLFPNAHHAPRFGGAGLHMYLLGNALACDRRFEVAFVFSDVHIEDAQVGNVLLLERKPPIRRGVPLVSRAINRRRLTEPYAGGGNKVIISTMAINAPLLLREARLAGAKSIFQTASETDVAEPRGVVGDARELVLDSIAAADAVLVQTEQQRASLVRSRGRNSLVVRKGMPIPKKPEWSDKVGVLWVGSSQALKQPWYFLDLARSFPEHEFTMVAPPAEKGVYDYIRRQASNIANLHLVDRQIPYPEIQRYFDRAKIFVYTSEFGTDPAMTVLQAGMGACAILSERLDPEDGMFSVHGAGLVAGGDFRRLSDMLGTLLADDEQCRILGNQAYEYVSQKHALDTMVSAYADVIETLFSDAGSEK